MTQCTVSLLSWKRVENINKIIEKYNFYSCIGDIIVWNNNPSYLLSDLGLPKVKIINCSRDLGLDTRFAAALLAENRCVIAHDDDLLLSEINISNLINNWEQDCSRIYTYEGRIVVGGKYSCTPGPQRIENVDIPVEVDVSLTRTACFDKLLAAEYMRWADAIFYDVENNLNGEDIALSYISRKMCGKRPLVIPIPDQSGYEELLANDKISTRNGFIERRCKIAQRCDLMFPRMELMKPIDVDKTKTIITTFGPDMYPMGSVFSSWTLNATMKQFVVDDSTDGRLLWFEMERGMDHMIGVIPLKSNWSSIKLSPNDKLIIKCLDFGDGVSVEIRLALMESHDSKEFQTERYCLTRAEPHGRVLTFDIPIGDLVNTEESNKIFTNGFVRSVIFTCFGKDEISLKILELKIMKGE